LVRPWTAQKRVKRLLIFASIGVILFSIAYVLSLGNNNPHTNISRYSPAGLVADSKQEAIKKYQLQFCGTDSRPNSNQYVQEYKLPQKCEMPLAVNVNDNGSKVWYISTKNGTIGEFDIKLNKFEKEKLVPIWKSRAEPIDSSQVWDMKSDKNGDLWFTDEKQNAIWRYFKSAQRFEMYKVPENSSFFGTTYPVSLDFDENGNLYFVGIRSPSLWIGNLAKLRNGTSEGISKISIPISAFRGIDPELVSTGSLAVDKKNGIVWISMLAFNTKGQLIKYDIRNKSFKTYNMPEELSSPVGIAIDSAGNPWVTDHGTSLFFKLDSSSGNVTKFSTSKASARIFGGNDTSVPQGAYTLPYWIKSGYDGTLWFNEHTGNKIAKFDPGNLTLTEYWIPTQDNRWGQCVDPNVPCGIANALQFSVGHGNNQVWFSEWSENKIGMINASKSPPILISVSPPDVTIRRGQSSEIKVQVKAVSNAAVNMLSSSPFTRNGDLGNSTGTFSEDKFNLAAGTTKDVSYIFTPASNIKPGQYILMLGADVSPVTVMKAVKVNLV
jgi:virginiamycin B lyase